LIAVGVLAGASAWAAPKQPDLDAVLKRLDDLYRSKASIGKMELTVIRPGSKRTMVMRVWTRGEDRALIVIDSPAREAGTATLRVGKNLWNYLPRIARTIRIPPSMMLSSWMGSDFTNDDLVQESSYLDDYNAKIVGRSADPAGWQVRLDAKPGTVGLWKRIDLVISDDGWLPLEEKHYDRRGDLARVMRFDQVRNLGGRRIPTRIVVTPLDKKGHRTEMRYIEMEFNADVPESTFSLQRLERNR
jgi:outer membrane lipoprotein-sorting protein